MPTYEVTCALDGQGGGTPGGAINRLLETTASMREEGVEITHNEVTIGSDRDGSTSEMSARFTAPTEGIIGWHVWRARLPVCGIRRIR